MVKTESFDPRKELVRRPETNVADACESTSRSRRHSTMRVSGVASPCTEKSNPGGGWVAHNARTGRQLQHHFRWVNGNLPHWECPTSLGRVMINFRLA